MMAHLPCIAHPPTKAHSKLYFFVIFFDLHGITGNSTPPSHVRLKTYQPPKHPTHPVDTIHPQHARTGMDTDTSMEAIAAPYHSGPIGSHQYLLLPRLEAGSRRFFLVHPAYRYRCWYCLSCRGSNPEAQRALATAPNTSAAKSSGNSAQHFSRKA